MFAQRSLIRPPQMDQEGAYTFAQLTIDGYSGGDTQDGYLMGLVLQDGYSGGGTTIKMDAHTGAITQLGTGQVSFNGNVDAKSGLDVTGGNLTVSMDAIIQGNTTIAGDLTVSGTTTTLDTQQLVVADPITVLNASGSELTSTWTGLSVRDGDGYNRTGWVFNGTLPGSLDGYWGLSINNSDSSAPDVAPDRAIAYLGRGDAYGDLSSTLPGNSGADKIGFYSANFDSTSTTVSLALEELRGDITQATSETASNHYTINADATAGLDESACLIAKAGSGTALVDGYLCLVTDDVSGDRWEFKQYRTSTLETTQLHVGEKDVTSDINACVYLNSGDGTTTHSASLCLDGSSDTLTIDAGKIQLTGDITLGSDPGDCVSIGGVLCSDINPCCDDAYSMGDPTHRWHDGYFTNIWADDQHITNLVVQNILITNLEVDGYTNFNGDVTLGDGPEDCITINGVLCSSITPCCNDAYDLGDSTHRFNEGFFTNLSVSGTITAENVIATGDVTLGTGAEDCITLNGVLCSSITPCCDDAYDLGDAGHRFNEGFFTNLNVSGTITAENVVATGDVTLGTGPEDCITLNGVLCSDIIPCCDDAYSIGDPTHRLHDGYFVNIWAEDQHITNLVVQNILITNLEVDGYTNFNGDVTLGDGPEDCITLNGVLCSSITPCCNDAYDLGDSTHRFNEGFFTGLNVSGTITAENIIATGDVTLGNGPEDCITLNGVLCSDIIPCCDDAYQFGNTTHRFQDGYFTMPTFVNFTPVGDLNSLIGVLKGIDTELGNAAVAPPRGVYVVTSPEGSSDSIDSSRTVNQGTVVNVSGLTDAEFRDYIYIYFNGQLLRNDPTPSVSAGTVQFDVARKTGDLKTLLFSGNIRRNDVIQVVDMR